MEPVSTEVESRCLAGVTWSIRRTTVLIAGMILVMTAGCVSLGPLAPAPDAAPASPPCQVVATWSNQVVLTPDPTHNGDPTPGLAGRVYLFGQTIDYPVAGEGSMTVDLFDDSRPSPGKAPIPLEEWRLDRDTLKRLLRRDAIGWGYTIFLPWGTYRPEITRVRLKLRYNPVNGTPLFAGNAPLTLNKDNTSDLDMGSVPVAPSMETSAKATSENSVIRPVGQKISPTR